MGFLPWLLLFASPAALGQQNFILDRFEFRWVGETIKYSDLLNLIQCVFYCRGMRNVLHNDTQNHFVSKSAKYSISKQ